MVEDKGVDLQRNIGGSVAAAGANGGEARLYGTLDGTLRPYDRRGEKYVVSSTLDRVDWNAEHVELKLVSRLEFDSGAVAMRYEPNEGREHSSGARETS